MYNYLLDSTRHVTRHSACDSCRAAAISTSLLQPSPTQQLLNVRVSLRGVHQACLNPIQLPCPSQEACLSLLMVPAEHGDALPPKPCCPHNMQQLLSQSSCMILHTQRFDNLELCSI